MRHIKLFEGHNTDNIEKYFKDKIDWKFINYAQTIFLDYEYMGHRIRLSVILYDENDIKPTQYIWSYMGCNQKYMNMTGYTTMSYLEDFYGKYGISYEVSIIINENNISNNVNEESEIEQKYMEDICNKITLKYKMVIYTKFSFKIQFKLI